MSMHIPLAVRLKTAKVDLHITRDVRDLSFRSTAPGGYAAASLALDRPLLFQPDEIAYYASLHIYDGRCGCVVWEGRVEDLGRGTGADGEVWEVGAVGPSAHAQDRTVPLIYVDRRQEAWIKSRYSHKAAQVGSSDNDDQVPAIEMQFMRGAVATNLSTYFGDVMYFEARNSGQRLARVSCDHIEGVTDGNWRIKLLTRQDDGSSPGSVVNHQAWTTQQAIAGKVGDANFDATHNAANLRFDRDTGGVTVSDDDTWTNIKNIVVRTQLKDVNGTDITSGYTSDTVLASDVVKDLLGRLLPKYDGAGASITTTTHGIEQLAFPDGVTASDVLNELMRLEPAYLWQVWESNSAGKHRFEWRTWPASVRYEATVKGGFNSPASADGLYNRATVGWIDSVGRRRALTRTQTVDELTAYGADREIFLDLGDEVGTTANATKAGDEFLAEHRTAPNRGTLVIDRPVLDRDRARMASPWEILPGYLIRVRGVRPSIDSLNATSRDGVAVFRIVAVEYSTSSATATLDLDAYPVTVAQALADVARRPWARYSKKAPSRR